MKTRRGIIASGLAVATGGCLGGFGEDPYYTVDARVVNRDVGVLEPTIGVPDSAISAESTATVEISLQNQSFRSVRFRQPSEQNRFGSPYSVDREAALAEPDNVIRTAVDDSSPCWRQIEPQSNWSLFDVYRIRPWVPESRLYSVAAPHGDGCLSPGTYTFESKFGRSEENTSWTFELEIHEA
ncbi:hypothetical protein [Halolamina salifodinae]|uniref:Lipoprotein n=1 Tax=Halolamina salifodinae TaxID=1202767 RepID=A0A8T4GTS2_9EURY|nr:hypothetical protein [Halolamina salifodinae]MBP1986289.1 hypothetical protein [Halolamina salifodinae]